MTATLNIGDFILKKDKKNNCFTPFLFQANLDYSEVISSLKKLVDYMREKERIKVVDFNYDDYVDFFSNKKLGQVFITLLTRAPFCDILSELPNVVDGEELLHKIWIEVNKSHQGFCDAPCRQNDVFQQVKKRLASHSLVLDSNIELNSLYHDHASQQIFSFRLEDISVENLLISYNRALFQALLKISSVIEFLIDTQHISGDFYKRIFWKSRGLLVDYVFIDKKLSIRITGPKELVGRYTLYNRTLVRVFFEIVRLTRQYGYQTRVIVSVDFLNRKRTVRIPVAMEEILLYSKNETKEASTGETKLFDSNVERSFYEAFNHFSSRWKIQREPEVLFLEDTVIIPDFTIHWKDVKFYLEIVGFWTSKYLDKKFVKLRKLSSTKVKFIVLIDSRLKMGNTGLPTFHYKGLMFPLQEIITFLDTNYYKKAFMIHKNSKISEIIHSSSSNGILPHRKFIRNEELFVIFEIAEIRELEEFFTDKNLLDYLDRLEFIVVPGFGVVSKNYLKTLKDSILSELKKSFSDKEIKSRGLDYNSFIKNFKADEMLLKHLIESSGYDIIWVSLVKSYIRKKN